MRVITRQDVPAAVPIPSRSNRNNNAPPAQTPYQPLVYTHQTGWTTVDPNTLLQLYAQSQLHAPDSVPVLAGFPPGIQATSDMLTAAQHGLPVVHRAPSAPPVSPTPTALSDEEEEETKPRDPYVYIDGSQLPDHHQAIRQRALFGVLADADSRKGIRVPQACELCRKRKVKCTGIKPTCQRCQMKGLECIWALDHRANAHKNIGCPTFSVPQGNPPSFPATSQHHSQPAQGIATCAPSVPVPTLLVDGSPMVPENYASFMPPASPGPDDFVDTSRSPSIAPPLQYAGPPPAQPRSSGLVHHPGIPMQRQQTDPGPQPMQRHHTETGRHLQTTQPQPSRARAHSMPHPGAAAPIFPSAPSTEARVRELEERLAELVWQQQNERFKGPPPLSRDASSSSSAESYSYGFDAHAHPQYASKQHGMHLSPSGPNAAVFDWDAAARAHSDVVAYPATRAPACTPEDEHMMQFSEFFHSSVSLASDAA